MNHYMEMKWSWIEGSHAMRTTLLSSLGDADLAFTPGGQNVPFGELIREMGDVEFSYVESLKTFSQDWSSHNSTVGLAESVEKLAAWMQLLDEQLKSLVESFTDEDLSKTVKRGEYAVPVEMQLDIYLQAILIFFGKATVYLRAMERALPDGWKEYIG
jgi:hypothetical protein